MLGSHCQMGKQEEKKKKNGGWRPEPYWHISYKSITTIVADKRDGRVKVAPRALIFIAPSGVERQYDYRGYTILRWQEVCMALVTLWGFGQYDLTNYNT